MAVWRRFVVFILCVLFIVLFMYFMQQAINYFSYDLAGPSYIVIEPLVAIGIAEDAARAIYWYFLQLLISLVLVALLYKGDFVEAGFNTRQIRLSRRIIGWFVTLYPLLVAGSWLLIYFIAGIEALTGLEAGKSFSYIMQDLLVFGLLPGLGEEPFFRIVVLKVLSLSLLRTVFDANRLQRGLLILTSALLFSIGHIYVHSLQPFVISYNSLQLATAFALGLFYAYSYLKTRSILSAVVCHNYSDFIVRLFFPEFMTSLLKCA